MKMSRLRKLNQKKVWHLLIGIGLVAIAAQFWPENWYARSQVRDILIKSAPPQDLLAELQPYIKVGDTYDAVHYRLAPQPYEYKPITNNTTWSLQVGKDVGLVVAMRASGEVVGIGRYRAGFDKSRIEWLANCTW
jgi:hypothetical protein